MAVGRRLPFGVVRVVVSLRRPRRDVGQPPAVRRPTAKTAQLFPHDCFPRVLHGAPCTARRRLSLGFVWQSDREGDASGALGVTSHRRAVLGVAGGCARRRFRPLPPNRPHCTSPRRAPTCRAASSSDTPRVMSRPHDTFAHRDEPLTRAQAPQSRRLLFSVCAHTRGLGQLEAILRVALRDAPGRAGVVRSRPGEGGRG